MDDIEQAKSALIKSIDEMMLGHVRRAMCDHILKHGNYSIHCTSILTHQPLVRSFVAFDEDIVDQYGIQIIGVSYNEYSHDVFLSPESALKAALPPELQHAHWRLHIEDGSENIVYDSESDIKLWSYIACSPVDQAIDLSQIEAVKAVIDSHCMLVACSA